jgi:hypothetical protein
MLNEGRQLFASKYQLVLPSEKEQRQEIERERAMLDHMNAPDDRIAPTTA